MYGALRDRDVSHFAAVRLLAHELGVDFAIVVRSLYRAPEPHPLLPPPRTPRPDVSIAGRFG
jgi:hypothetical protein